MDMKKMGFADRVIFILGLIFTSVLTIVLVIGVIVAVLKFYMGSKERTIQVQPDPMLKDDPGSPWGSVSTSKHLSEDEEWQVNDEQETRNQGMSKFFSDAKNGFLNFANHYSIAVKSGANVAGKQLIEAMVELNQPSDITAGKVIAAVKIGVQHASEHMVNSSIEFVEQMKNSQKSNKE